MPNKRPPIKRFKSTDRTLLLTQARLLLRQDELDLRVLDRRADSSFLCGRILIITPRKIGTAPQRNKLRRRFAALFFEEGFYKKPYDIVIYARKKSIDIPFDCLKKLLHSALDTLPTSTKAKTSYTEDV